MATWRRYPHGVVVFTYRDSKQRKLPRAETRHLDTEPDHNIDTWVRQWALSNERSRPQWQTLTNSDILGFVERFAVYMASRRRSPKTVAQHRHNLTRYALPFLVQKEGLAEPSLWPHRSVRLLDHLLAEGVGTRTITTVNVALRTFWHWLVEEGLATGTLLLRNPVRVGETTPLRFTVSPKDILTARLPGQLQLLAMIGYFFSLRPQELVALRPRDFLAGSKVGELDCGKAMTGAGLFNRLAVNIHRQRVGNDYKTPKAGSRGWVACFDEKGARAIVGLLGGKSPEDLLFPFRLDHWFTLWRRNGYAGITLKDLRRASIYWLGHNTALPFAALKNHARHSDPSTTALYVRRPEDDTEAWGLDLDA